MKVEITLTEDMLGTACANPEVHKEFIASKSKDADKMKEELESLPAEEKIEKATTVFHRDTDGMPIIYDYVFKGTIKEGVGVLVDMLEKEVRIGKTKLTKYTHKRIVDNFCFVFPRKIRLAPVSRIMTRPLRAMTMQGERISLASSEVVPAGTKFTVEIRTLVPALNDMLVQVLDYGALKGIGQWRNAGWGRYSWQEVK